MVVLGPKISSPGPFSHPGLGQFCHKHLMCEIGIIVSISLQYQLIFILQKNLSLMAQPSDVISNIAHSLSIKFLPMNSYPQYLYTQGFFSQIHSSLIQLSFLYMAKPILILHVSTAYITSLTSARFHNSLEIWL